MYIEAVQIHDALDAAPNSRQSMDSIPHPEVDSALQEKKPSHPIIHRQTFNQIKAEGIENHQKKLDPLLTTEIIPVGTYNKVGGGVEEEKDHISGPVLPSRSVCHKNPTYDPPWSLLHEVENHSEDIYADPDASFQEESQLTCFEAVYSNSLVLPSAYGQTMDQPQNNSKLEQDGEEKREDEFVKYDPIYSLCYTSPPLEQQLLTVTSNNIREVKVFGTGFFGKVILADTVGLSPKDLKLTYSDNDKSVSVQVTLKKLKLSASKSTQEIFEREYRSMSQLDHPNIIRLLGPCTTKPSRFIMMEFMEREGLNNYFTNFKTIVSEGVPKEREILVSTLVYMCTQIANAMKYLVSRNFIHRDLAARNCLVGPNNLIKVADFEMSQSLYESHYYTLHGQAALPIRWMATECFYGKFSTKTDIWAFGVTMWEIFMLAKERPYSEMEDLEVVNDAVEKEERSLLQQLEHCPDNVFEVVMRCWTCKPKDRATFDELHAMLSQLSISIHSVDDSIV